MYAGPEVDDILGGEGEVFENDAEDVGNGELGRREEMAGDEISLTATVMGITDDDKEKEEIELPKNVQKLLEEKVQKEVEKQRNSGNGL